MKRLTGDPVERKSISTPGRYIKLFRKEQEKKIKREVMARFVYISIVIFFVLGSVSSHCLSFILLCRSGIGGALSADFLIVCFVPLSWENIITDGIY